MADRWRSFDLEVTDELCMSWRGMAEAFGFAMLDGMGMADTLGDRSNVWRALQLPTGTGKTQGTALYAAMLAEKNRQAKPDQPKSGILFVTALIKEANKFVATVNGITNYPCAAARHSDATTSVSFEAIADYDVLAITHQAYLSALGHELDGADYGRLPDYLALKSGRRLLTIIDERISNLVWTGRISEQDVLLALAGATRKVREAHPWLHDDLDRLRDAIGKTDEIKDEAKKAAVLWREGRSSADWQIHKTSIRAFSAALKENLRSSPPQAFKVAKSFTGWFSHVMDTYQALGDGYGRAFERRGQLHFGTSRLILPDDMPGPVVLDATATQEPLWALLGDKVRITPAVPEVRNYSRLTLHVARIDGVGKNAMSERKPSVVGKALKSVPPMADGSDTFLCVHKVLEDKLDSEALKNDGVLVDHWGNIDGRNDWKDCGRAMLLGLSFPPQEWPMMVKLAALTATQVANEADVLTIGAPDRFAITDTEFIAARTTASIVQAINRIRCRQVIDADGNCPQAEAYVTLPIGDRGAQILERLKTELPGVKIASWGFHPDDEQSIPWQGYLEQLLKAAQALSPGDHPFAAVAQSAGLNKNHERSLKCQLGKGEGPAFEALVERGIRYRKGSKGRGNAACLTIFGGCET